LRRKLVDPFLERLDSVRRCVAPEIEERRRQCAGCGCELRVLSAERGTCAQQANVSQRILQKRVAALEALRQFLLPGDRRGQAVGKADCRAATKADRCAGAEAIAEATVASGTEDFSGAAPASAASTNANRARDFISADLPSTAVGATRAGDFRSGAPAVTAANAGAQLDRATTRRVV